MPFTVGRMLCVRDSRCTHETVSAEEMYGHLAAIRHIMAGGRAKTAKRMIGDVTVPASE